MKQDIIEIGYCPEQLDEIDYHAWLQGEGVAYIKSVEDDIYLQMPLVRLFTRILELCKDGLKLTSSGYLPNKIVAEVYPLGPKDFWIENGYSKLGTHANCMIMKETWEIFLKMGLVRKRKGILSLTQTGKTLYDKPEALFAHMLEMMSTVADPAILDGYEFYPFNDRSQYLCALLENNNGEFMPVELYARSYANRQPILWNFLNDQTDSKMAGYAVSAFTARLFRRFLEWFNLVEVKDGKYDPDTRTNGITTVRTTELFHKVIGINPPLTSKEYYEQFTKDTIALNAREAKDFFEVVGADVSEFPEEEIKHCDAVKLGEEVTRIFINPKGKKYLS